MLVRRIARPLLASTFISGGIDALRHPDAKAPKAEKLDIPSKPGMDKLHITTTEQAVRVNAAVQVAAGTLLSLNRLPRLSALALAGSIVPTTLAGHRFWEEQDPAKRSGSQQHFFKNASMLGGLLIAAVDTEGRESLRRKTTRVSKRSQRKAAKVAANASAKAASKDRKKAAKKVAKKQADRIHDLLPV
ncbi:MAG TPA: DoxX family protein [Frankiaceae bacterium]|nr:DoxX family protein [Frankiaceae bacterium]